MNKQALILGEIAWCEAHRGESRKGELWEDGFIQGLKQALRLMRSRPTQTRVDSTWTNSNSIKSPEPVNEFFAEKDWTYQDEISMNRRVAVREFYEWLKSRRQ